MNAISIINALPSTNAQGEAFKTIVKDMILSGDEDPLRYLVQLTALEKWVGELRKDGNIEDAILSEFERYGEKTLKIHGAELTAKEVGVSYDYSNCDDLYLQQLEREKAFVDKEIKTRQDFLKSIKKQTFDGNGIEIFAPVKISKTKVTCKLC
jgi:hypothetical protein